MSNVFKFVPFSRQQRRILNWWTVASPVRDANGIIADGAIRSGKTMTMALSFSLWAMSTFRDRDFAICGKTVGSFRRNVLPYIKSVLPGQGYVINDRRSENLVTITRGDVTNNFFIFGGKDERSQDLIQGMTLAGVLLDEVALMPESFVAQATARCSVAGSKFWFNCNPSSPHHWFKVDWVDRADERRLLYLKFTMDDNLSLSDEVKARYRSMYAGAFYQRYILGKWTLAEGLIYSMFSSNAVRADAPFPLDEAHYVAACDYGTNNPFAMGLFARQDRDGVDRYHMVAEYYHDGRKRGQKTDGEYADDVTEFFHEHGSPEYIFIDPSASSFITEMRKRGFKVIKANNSVLDGIHYVSQALIDGRLTVGSDCKATIKEFGEYVWDEAAGQRGEDKPLKQNDHAMDMIRYALYSDRHNAIKRSNRTRRDGAV